MRPLTRTLATVAAAMIALAGAGIGPADTLTLNGASQFDEDHAQVVGMHPIHFAIIGVVSLAFGLITPPMTSAC